MDEQFIHITGTESSRNNEIWDINVNGFFKQAVERQMLEDEDGFSQDAVDSIFSNAARILSHCPNPNNACEKSETGLVIGKVQSGKTSNFISLLALAFDNGYDIAVVLGGITLELLKQNASRINSAFSVDVEKLNVLKTNDNKALINAERIKEFIENGRKIVIVGLKHIKHINQIAEIFDNEYLRNKPILIIDDEGDQATLNTKAYMQSMSKTYESVIRLKSKLKRHCFLSVTATPQANILIEVFDRLSPDFGELVYPGNGYCGLQTFHGENSDIFIRDLPMNEVDLMGEQGVPDSIYEAMAMFFVGNAIRRSRGDTGNHAMLIHPSLKKPDHRMVVKKVQSILDDWKAKARLVNKGKRDISYNSLRALLLDAYNSFKNDGVTCVPFEELEPTIIYTIIGCSPVHICNSDENASENSRLYKTNIFVGGNLVERGITIKGLAVTYITRRAKGKSNVDNMEQRARWFGYKEKYLDVCRVYTTKDIKDDFSSILEHDEDMWTLIETYYNKGVAFKDMPRIFKLSRNAFLQLTRSNVAKTEPLSFSPWKKQDYFITDKIMSDKNTQIISKYKLGNKDKIVVKQYNEKQRHSFLPAVKYSSVYENLLSQLNYRADELLSNKFFELLYTAFDRIGIDPAVDVVWIRDTEEHSTRRILDDDSIQQLFQGRNPNTSSENYYNGDRSLVEMEPEHLQLQIHYVKPTNRPDLNYYAPALALFIPDKCLERLAEFVGRKNG